MFFWRPSGPSGDRLGTILASFWECFGSQNRCQHRPQRKCQNWAPVEARIKNSRFGGHRKTSKIGLKASYRTSTLKDAKITKKSRKNGPKTFPKRAPRGSKNSTYNLGTKFLTSEIGSKSNVKNELKKTLQKTLPRPPGMLFGWKKGVTYSPRSRRGDLVDGSPRVRHFSV